MPELRPHPPAPNRTAVVNGLELWTLGAIAVYVGAFYWIDPRRRLFLSQLLVPEDLVASWVDGDWSRFGLLDHMPVWTGAAVIWLVSGLTGWLVLQALRADRSFDWGEQVVLSLAVGLNCWSLLTLAIGLCGELRSRGLFACFAGLLVALACWRLVAIRRQSRSAVAEATAAFRAQSLSRFGQLALVLCIPLAVVIMLGGTLPATHFDVREYHLQVPKEWFQQGRITLLPHNVYGNMPLGAEMHAVLGMLLVPGRDGWWWGALIGKTVIAAFGPLAAAGVFFLGRRWISADAGAWGAFAYLATPWIAHVSMTGLIDGAVACYVVTAAAVALRVVLPTEENRPLARGPLLALAGFLAGAAVACKYPPLLLLVAPLGLLVTLWPRNRIDWKAATLFSLGVAAGCGLWLGKNWVLTGNPTYPLLYSVFGAEGTTWNAEKNTRWTKAHGPPIDAHGHRYSAAQAWDSVKLLAINSDHHGPWLVPLAVAALWTWRSPRHRILLAIGYGLIAFSVACWWLLTHRVDRFLVPMLPLAALGAGIGAAWTQTRFWRYSVGVIGGCCCLASFTQIASPFAADNRFLIALSDLRHDLPRSETQPYTRMNNGHRWLNDHVPPNRRVLLVGEAQVFDLEMPILYNTCFDDCVLETLLKGRSRDERARVLRDEGISHIFVSWYELSRYRQPGNYGYSDYPTPQLFYEELVAGQGLLRPVPIGKSGEVFEIFAVVE